MRESGATLISIAHRPAVLRHHTHVLHLLGEGAWKLHEAGAYQFDEPLAAVAPGDGSTPSMPAREAAVAG
ncbi:MAG: hypothetical protein V4633_00315 [Pseudomonadota bacterium]